MWLSFEILISANLGENKTLLKYIVAESNGKNLANYLLFSAMSADVSAAEISCLFILFMFILCFT